MKTYVQRAALILAVAAISQGFATAQDALWTSGGQATLVSNETVATTGQTTCTSCDPTCCPGACGAGGLAGCEEGPAVGVVGIFGFDAFNGISENRLQSNFGPVLGFNTAAPLFGLAEYGFGWQTGLTYGVYDLDGRVDALPGVNTAESQQQIFVTTGFYRKAGADQRLNFGLVYDWMFNTEWGALGVSPTLGQWRGQVEYILSNSNGVGVYGCLRDLGAVSDLFVTTRPISQVNLFWHHKFDAGADSWLWVGVPERDRLSGAGSLGDWIVGANVQVPLSEKIALYGNAQYMHPSQAAGPQAALDSTWNVGAGIMWYLGGHARSESLNGKCWTSYLPMANNSNFLVDQRFVN
jgi:hypothetical protein